MRAGLGRPALKIVPGNGERKVGRRTAAAEATAGDVEAPAMAGGFGGRKGRRECGGAFNTSTSSSPLKP